MKRREQIRKRVAEILDRPVATITDAAELNSLVNSSFLLVELVIELQEEFSVRFRQEDMNHIATAGQLIDLVDSRAAAQAPG